MSNQSPPLELTDIHLQAMQEVSARLMDALPAGEQLWHVLAETEILLREAQFKGVPPQELFGPGGTAAFCQSIVDEYNAERGKNQTNGSAEEVPASRDPSIKASHKLDAPRGGVAIRRRRRATVILVTTVCLLFAVLACWYTGFLRYLTDPTGFYLEELYNFENTAIPLMGDDITLALTPKVTTGISERIYFSPDGLEITLKQLNYRERHVHNEYDLTTGQGTYVTYWDWYLQLSYTTDVHFNRIRYVEPTPEGTVILTLADGTVHTGSVAAGRSGVSVEGHEYCELEIFSLPADTDLTDASLTVHLSSPRRMVWERIGVGRRG